MVLYTRRGEITLGRTISRAGEGVVAEIAGSSDVVVKMYHGLAQRGSLLSANHDPLRRLAKVAVMLEHQPPHAVQPDGHVVLAWPQDILLEDGQPVGYTMPKIEWTQVMELRDLVGVTPGARTPAHIPSWAAKFPWQYRVHAAINLCRAVEVAHSTGGVIGDFNERNVLVSPQALVSLVDCDSMQFIGPGGEVFPCDVGHRDFTAPELVGQDLATVTRTRDSDYFALAIHIHRLLLGGVHPFLGGVWTGEGDRKNVTELSRLGQYVGGPPPSLLTFSSREPDPKRIPSNIRAMFDQAFRVGARRPSARPSAAEWATALEAMLDRLRAQRVARGGS
jgi:DNA-binding helix-hairpin-helix protein with protein kinase domain